MANIVVVSLSPTIGTPTHNTSGYDELVFVSGKTPLDTVNVKETIIALCDASATPTTEVAQNPLIPRSGAIAGTTYATVAFAVPNGYYWTISGTLNAIVNAWAVQFQAGSLNVRDLTASRATNTQYRNTTGNAIFIYPELQGVTTNTISIVHDSTPSPTTAVFSQTPDTTPATYTPFAIIPNGHYYKVTSSPATTLKWIEAQLPIQATRTDITATKAVNTIYQNLTAEATFEVPIIQNNSGGVGARSYHTLLLDTVTPPVKFGTTFADTDGNELETMPTFVGVNQYYKESTNASGVDTLNKWWQYTFVNSALNGIAIVQFALP